MNALLLFGAQVYAQVADAAEETDAPEAAEQICLFPTENGQIIFLLAIPVIALLVSHFFLNTIIKQSLAKKNYSPAQCKNAALSVDFLITTVALIATSSWINHCVPTEVLMIVGLLVLLMIIFGVLFFTSKNPSSD